MGKILKFKKKEPVDPLALKAKIVDSELRRQMATLNPEEMRSFLLLHLAQICYYIFDLNSFQDPRTVLHTGINRLFSTWCKSKTKKTN